MMPILLCINNVVLAVWSCNQMILVNSFFVLFLHLSEVSGVKGIFLVFEVDLT